MRLQGCKSGRTGGSLSYILQETAGSLVSPVSAVPSETQAGYNSSHTTTTSPEVTSVFACRSKTLLIVQEKVMQLCSLLHEPPASPPRPARRNTPVGAGEQSGGRRRCGLADVFVRHGGVCIFLPYRDYREAVSACRKYSISASEDLGRECWVASSIMK